MMSPGRKGERNPKPKPRSKAVCSFLNLDVDISRKTSRKKLFLSKEDCQAYPKQDGPLKTGWKIGIA